MWLGILAFYRQEFQDAYDLYHRSTAVLESAGEKLEAAYGYYNLTEVCLKMDRDNEARDWYVKGLRCIDARQNPSLAKLFSDLGKQLSEMPRKPKVRLYRTEPTP